MSNKRHRSKKWISWLIILLLLVGAVVVSVMVWDSYFKPKTNDEPKPAEQSSKKEDNPEQKKEEEKPETKTEEEKKIEQYDGADPNNAEEITGVITYAGVSGDNLMIRVNIDQYLTGGTCKLNLGPNGSSVYNTIANVVDSASTSTCEGFNVPLSSLPSGKLNIVINIESNGKTGVIAGEANI